MTQRVPVIEGLFAETPDGPRLLGSRCASCRTSYFPKTTACRNPDCPSSQIEDASLGPRGTLWSFSVQHYPPPPPAKYEEPYTPYALGLVDLPEGIRVLSRIATRAPDKLVAGSTVVLVIDKLYTNSEGDDVVTWMFAPVDGKATR